MSEEQKDPEMQCRDPKSEVINQLLERGQTLRQAMTRSLVQDETLLESGVTRDTDDLLSDQDICQDVLLDYLLGKTLTSAEEARALSTLKDIPMVEEILEALDINSSEDKQSTHGADNDVLTPRSRTVSNASSLRLKLCLLELSESGLRYLARGTVSVPHQTPPTFLLEYMPPRSCPGQQGQTVRLCSHKVTGRGVIFGQEKLHSCDSRKPVTFKIYYRHLNSRTPALLGCAEFDWDALLKTESLSCEVNLPVLHSKSKKEVFGRLKIKAMLGQGNFLTKKPTSQYKDTESVTSSSQTIPRTIVSENVAYPQATAAPAASEPHTQEGSAQSTVSANEKTQLLQGLIHVTQSRGFIESQNLNLFIILKAFWIEDKIRSQVMWKCQNPCFDLHEKFPILLSPFFLERCKGNHAVLEVWDAHSTGNRLIGIFKLPLQTFYLAYQDSDVADKLLSLKLPVISVDHWVSVLNPVSGAKAGELLVLLAFGSGQQVAHIEYKRGLRSLSSFSPQYPSPQVLTPASSSSCIDSQIGINKIHKLEVIIDKITGFTLFESIPNGEADCFVDWRLPVRTASGPAFKTFVSDMTLCSLEPKFSSQLSHILRLPESVSFARFVTKREKRGVTFRLWCRFYEPSPRDIIVAKATLSPRELAKLEALSSNRDATADVNVSLPLNIVPCPETSKLCDETSGHLIINLKYSSYSENEAASKMSDFGSTRSLSSTKSQACQTDATRTKHPVKFSSTQTSLQLTDFVPETEDEYSRIVTPQGSDCTQISTERANINATATQTNVQMTDFVPETEESDDDCRILPSPLSQETKNQHKSPEKSSEYVTRELYKHTSSITLNYRHEILSQNTTPKELLSDAGVSQDNPDTPRTLIEDSNDKSQIFDSPYHQPQQCVDSRSRPQAGITHIPVVQDDPNTPKTVVNDPQSADIHYEELQQLIDSANQLDSRLQGAMFQLPVQTDNTEAVKTLKNSNKIVGGPHQQLRQFIDPGNVSGSRPQGAMFRAHIEVERAVNLPILEDVWYNTLVEPSTYMTMPAEQPGMLVASPLVCKSSNPVYNWHCDTKLPAHLLMPGNQRLILKLWLAISDDNGHNPAADIVACFTTVGLQVLLDGLPQISGWFNLLDYAGQCQGQVKLCITPLESLHAYKEMRDAVLLQHQMLTTSQQQQQEKFPIFQLPPNPFTDMSTSAMEEKLKEQLADFDDLSNQLKAKVAAMNIELPPKTPPITRPPLVIQLASQSLPTKDCENPELLFPAPGFVNIPMPESKSPNRGSSYPPSGYLPGQVSLGQTSVVEQLPISTVSLYTAEQIPHYSYPASSSVNETPVQNLAPTHDYRREKTSHNPISVYPSGYVAPQRDQDTRPLSQRTGYLNKQKLNYSHPSSSNSEHTYTFPSYLTNPITYNPVSSQISLTNRISQSPAGFINVSLTGNSCDQSIVSLPDTNPPDVNEISSSDSTDSDVSKLLANFDLDTLHRLVEHLDDEVQKYGRCSKPDYVCEKKQVEVQTQNLSEIEEKETDESEILTPVSRQAPEGGNPTEKDKNSVSSASSVSSKDNKNQILRDSSNDE